MITFLTLTTPSGLRGDAYWAGFHGQVAGKDLAIFALGRYVFSGNSRVHPLNLLDENGNLLGQVSVNALGQPINSFIFQAFSSPVILPAGTKFFVVSSEGNGDNWMTEGPGFTTTADASVLSAVYANSGTGRPNIDINNQVYVPTNFQYAFVQHFPIQVADTSTVALKFHTDYSFPFRVADTSTVLALGFDTLKDFPLTVQDTSTVQLKFSHFYRSSGLPLNVIYTDVYSNVSGQVLEIDKYLVPPGHLWSRLFANRVLIGEDYSQRGYITQKLIDLGYIAKTIYAPIMPPGFFFMQSFESNNWFQVDAVEIDPTQTNLDTKADVSFQTTSCFAPPDETLINFNITIPGGDSFLLGLNDTYCIGIQLDTVIDPGDICSVYYKRPVQQFPSLTIPLAIPNTQNLVFLDQDNNQYALQVDDSGQLFFTSYFNISPSSLVGQDANGNDSLFWLSIEPILNGDPEPHLNLATTMNLPPGVQASYVGTYSSGPNCPNGAGCSGTVTFAWDAQSVAECEAGTSLVSGSSKDGFWSTAGKLTVLGLLQESSWGEP